MRMCGFLGSNFRHDLGIRYEVDGIRYEKYGQHVRGKQQYQARTRATLRASRRFLSSHTKP
jgi:hypothetical protein